MKKLNKWRPSCGQPAEVLVTIINCIICLYILFLNKVQGEERKRRGGVPSHVTTTAYDVSWKDGGSRRSNAALLSTGTRLLFTPSLVPAAAALVRHTLPECPGCFCRHEDLLRQSQPDHGSAGLGGGERGV